MSLNKSPALLLTVLSLAVTGCAANTSVLHTSAPPVVEKKPVRKPVPKRTVRKPSKPASKVDYRRYAHLDFKKHFDYSKKINTGLASFNCQQLRKEASHTDGVVSAMKPMMGNIKEELSINQQKAMNVAFFYTGLNKKLTTEFRKRCNS